MDSRLFLINGKRPTKLRSTDLPQLAQAIIDAERGRCEVKQGFVRGVAYVNLHKKDTYDVVVRGDDWAKIVPFLRNSTFSYTPPPAPPPPDAPPPPPVPAPQPNLMMQPPPPLPKDGVTSFLEGLPYPELRVVEATLTMGTISRPETRSAVPLNAVPLTPNIGPPPGGAYPAESSLNFTEQAFYHKVLDLLGQLFPEEPPTSYL